MTTFEYVGVVEMIGETKAIGSNGFTKRDIVVGNDIEVLSKYPNPVLFTFKRERCSLCDGIKKGDRVKVTFTIDGRRWDSPNGTRYFTDLTAWKIDVLNAGGSSEEPSEESFNPPPVTDSNPSNGGDTTKPAVTDEEDLPF